MISYYWKRNNETHVIPIPALDRVEENVFDKVYDKLESEGHRVGGYPAFTQLDPREYDEAFKEHTVLSFSNWTLIPNTVSRGVTAGYAISLSVLKISPNGTLATCCITGIATSAI